ncbi:MAG: hypothetical protein PHX58_13050 [Desulfovibrio sp.]|jgi:hypothetical protein|nr:hypothetical protein [Desulfovibrio sp.]
MNQEQRELEQTLCHLLGGPLPEHATEHINQALQVAGLLEQRGFEFRLLDARPKDPEATLWKALFSKGDRLFQCEHSDAALAVCTAAARALAR